MGQQKHTFGNEIKIVTQTKVTHKHSEKLTTEYEPFTSLDEYTALVPIYLLSEAPKHAVPLQCPERGEAAWPAPPPHSGPRRPLSLPPEQKRQCAGAQGGKDTQLWGFLLEC